MIENVIDAGCEPTAIRDHDDIVYVLINECFQIRVYDEYGSRIPADFIAVLATEDFVNY